MKYAAIRRRRDNVLQRLFQRPGVAIAGRDGTLAQSGATGATALHPTTGAVVSAGALISHNLPINGAGVLPMSFAQGARTNLLLRSQEFQTTWTLSEATIDDDATAGPDGTSSADKVIESVTASATHFVQQSSAKAASSLVYTGSVYAKAGERSYVLMYVRGSSATNRGQAVFNLTTGAVTAVLSNGTFSGASASCVAVGNGWFRCSVTVTSDTSLTVQMLLAPSVDSTLAGATYTGDGTSGLYVWGAQIEQAAFPGVYIPTTSAALTRVADNILWTPPSALSTTSGEVVAVAAPYLWSAVAGGAHPTATTARRWGANGTNFDGRSTTDAAFKSDGASQFAVVTSLADSSGVLRQTSNKWGDVSLDLYQGASLAASDVTLSPPWSAPSGLYVASSSGPAAHWFGFVGLIYVPGGLTDAERSALSRFTAGSITYVG